MTKRVLKTSTKPKLLLTEDKSDGTAAYSLGDWNWKGWENSGDWPPTIREEIPKPKKRYKWLRYTPIIGFVLGYITGKFLF